MEPLYGESFTLLQHTSEQITLSFRSSTAAVLIPHRQQTRHKGQEWIHHPEKEQGRRSIMEPNRQRQTGAGDRDVSQILAQIVREGGAAVVGSLPQREYEPDGVEVDPGLLDRVCWNSTRRGRCITTVP